MRRQGIALIMVLMVTGLLTILTGAFLGVQRSSLALLVNAKHQSMAYEACQSAVEYAWTRLANDPAWAAARFNSETLSLPPGGPPMMEVSTRSFGSVDTNVVSGKLFTQPESTFQMRVLNNLAGETNQVRAGYEVPALSVRILVEARTGSGARKLDVVLREVPLVDASAVSQGELLVDLDTNNPESKWEISSTDPSFNIVRSNSGIRAPYTRGRSVPLRMEFSLKGRNRRLKPPYGSLKAADKILMMDGGSRAIDMTDILRRQEQERLSKAAISPNSAKFNIPDISPGRLRTSSDRKSVRGGTFYFTWELVDQANPSQGYKSVLKHFNSVSADPMSATPDQRWTWNPWNRESPIQEIDGVEFDLANFRMKVPPDTSVDVISKNGSETGLRLAGAVPPTLVLEGGTRSSSLNTEGSKSPIKIDGLVSGQGALIAKQSDIAIQVGSDVSANLAQPIALYAGENLKLSASGANNPYRVLPANLDFYARAGADSKLGGGWGGIPDTDKDAIAADVATSVQMPAGDEWDRTLSSIIGEFPDVPDSAREKVRAYANTVLNGSPGTTGGTGTTGGGTAGSSDAGTGTGTSGSSEGTGGEPGTGTGTGTGTSGTGGGTPRAITAGDVVKIQQFLWSAKINPDSPDESWINSNLHDAAIPTLIKVHMNQLQGLAGFDDSKKPGKWNSLAKYIGSSRTVNPMRLGEEPPMLFRGLLYARNGDFEFNAEKRRITVEGSIVAKNGSLKVLQARYAKFTYNPDYLKPLFDPNKRAYHTLQQVYYNLR